MKFKSGWKRLSALAMGLCLTASVAAPSFAVNIREGAYKDGTYEGSAQGYYGLVTLAVTVKGNAVTKIDVVSHSDTQSYWNKAAVLMDKIIETQSTDLDTVSGATYSSEGILGAVNSALKKAEGNEVDLSFFTTGNGTQAHPYVISTAKQLRKFAKSVDEYNYSGCYVSLGANIDISGSDWDSIGNDGAPFNGTFDGHGYAIEGMTMGTEQQAYAPAANEKIIGLFSVLGSDAVVRNVNLTDVKMNVYSQDEVTIGTLVGKTSPKNSKESRRGAVIDNCHVDGSLSVKNTGKNIWAGGLMGYEYCGAVLNSSSDVDVTAAETTGENWLEAGGIAGINVWGLMANTYAAGDVTVSLYDHEQGQAEDETGGAAGGLCGLEYGEEHNCYATGNVTAVKKIDCIGALAGSFVKNSQVTNSWYNTQATLNNGGESVAVDAPSQNIKGTAENNNGFAADSTEAYRVKTALNRVVREQVLDFSNYGVQASNLNTWTMRSGVLVQGDAYACDGSNCPSALFRDVDESAWYHEAVDTALASGTMNGVGNALFAPNQTLSRAMLVQILYNAAEKPAAEQNSTFQDVSADSWYATAVAWAAQNGIVSGYGHGMFGPNDAVTREQAVKILYTYAQKQGADVSAQDVLDSYTDAGAVSAWAQNAMRWAVAKQIVNGTAQNTLSPRGTTTRAQAAQLIMRFFEIV